MLLTVVCWRVIASYERGLSPPPLPPHADQQRHLEPLPVAVDVLVAGVAQHLELAGDIEQAVGAVLALQRLSDRREERPMQVLARGGHVLEVREHPSGLQQRERLGVKGPLALMLEVVDRHPRDHRIEAPKLRKRRREIVLDDLRARLSGQTRMSGGKHQQ